MSCVGKLVPFGGVVDNSFINFKCSYIFFFVLLLAFNNI